MKVVMHIQFLFETPFNLRDDMLNCKSELTKEGKKVGYILKDDEPIAIIGYTE